MVMDGRSYGNRNMRLFRSSFQASPDMAEMFRDVNLSTDEMILQVLTEIRADVLRFLKGYTVKTRPGDYRAQFGPLFAGRTAPDRNKVEWSSFANWWKIPRPMHPGGWADITMELRQGYVSEVQNNGPADYTLTLDNTSEHAPFVEAMAGMFVVEGVFDPGSSVMRAIEHAFNKISRQTIIGPRGGRKLSKPTASVTTDRDTVTVKGV